MTERSAWYFLACRLGSGTLFTKEKECTDDWVLTGVGEDWIQAVFEKLAARAAQKTGTDPL